MSLFTVPVRSSACRGRSNLSRLLVHPCPLSRIELTTGGLAPYRKWVSTKANGLKAAAGVLQLEKPTFESVGVRAPIAQSLYAAFPNIKSPTSTQGKFISAIGAGKDILLKDSTGSGKSFGIVLGLLSKTRYRPRTSGKHDPTPKPYITSLLLVPHKDLAYQMLHWIQHMFQAASAPEGSAPPLDTIAQVLVRGSSKSMAEQLTVLRENPPHILIGTPKAVWQAVQEDPGAFQLENLSTVVVDEADYLIESIPRKHSKLALDKVRKKLDRHPSPTKQLLDMIYAQRVKQKETWGDEGDIYTRRPSLPGPQLVMSSATLRNHLKLYLNQSGWLEGTEIETVTGSGVRSIAKPGSNKSKAGGIQHHALLVSEDGTIVNIDGAQPTASTEADATAAAEYPFENDESVAGSIDIPSGVSERMQEVFSRTPSPFNPNCMEAIAAAFALDVPSVALLVLPAEAPVQRAIYDLRQLGVAAVGLDLLDTQHGQRDLLHGSSGSTRDQPILLVSTFATVRGIDLPELTHVFMLGIPGDRRVDTYLHVAGRVGRFGRGGRVIAVLEKSDETPAVQGDDKRQQQQQRDYNDQSRRMGMIYRDLGITPTRFAHFD